MPTDGENLNVKIFVKKQKRIVNTMHGTAKPQNFNRNGKFKEPKLINGIGRYIPG